MLTVIGEETAVQPPAFLLQHSDGHLNARLAQHLNTPTLHFGKGVNATYDDTLDTFLDNQFGTGRCLAIMGTRFQRHVDGCFRKQSLILRTYTGKGIHLGMSLTATDMIAFTNYFRGERNYDDGANHRIGTRSMNAVGCQL